MIVSPFALTKHYRLAQHYLERLRFIHDVYNQGGDHVLYALHLLNQDWAQIKQWHAWSLEHAAQHPDITALCSAYPYVARNLLDLVLTMQEHLHWQLEALNAAQELRNQQAEIAHLLAIARIHEKLDHYPQAREYAEQALRLSQALHDEHSTAQGTLLMGVLSNNTSHFTEACASFTKSLRIYRRLRDPNGIAMSVMGLGDVATFRGNYAEAQKYYKRALRMYRQRGDQRGVAESARALALALYYAGDYASATTHYDLALKISEQMSDKWGAANVKSDASMRTLGQHDITEAKTYAQETLETYRQIGSVRGMAQSLLNLGIIESLEENYFASQKHFIESVDLYRQIGNRYGIADSLISLTYTYQRMGETEAARLTLLEGLHVTLGIGAGRFIPMALGAMANQCLLKGRALQGAMLYGLADSSPWLMAHVREFAFPILRDWLATQIDATVLEEAIAQGRNLALDDTLKTIIQELAIPGSNADG